MNERGWRTAQLAGTAILGALVMVFDYTLKYSGLKIPFPWLPYLKFDFTGIPIVLSLLLYGLPSAATTSIVAFLAIVARSGNVVSAAMKAIAEFSTVLGVEIGLHLPSRYSKAISVVVGIALRIATMSVMNLVVLGVQVNLLPLFGVFNAIQGTFTVLVGYLLHKESLRRIPIQSRELLPRTR